MSSQHKFKIIGVFVLAFVLTVTLTACDMNGNGNGNGVGNGEEVIGETKTLNEDLAEDIGYNTKIPADYEVITEEDPAFILNTQNQGSKVIESVITEEVTAQQIGIAFEEEFNFLAGPNLRDLEEIDEDDFADEEEIIDEVTPLLAGITLLPRTEEIKEELKEQWGELYGDIERMKDKLEDEVDDLHDIGLETVNEREAFFAEYSNTEPEYGITITVREWVVLVEEEGKLISFNYADMGEEIASVVVDYAIENLDIEI